MGHFDAKFEDAFNHAMKYEVGPWWNPKDPEVIVGACETRSQQMKVGYVNHPADPGGETKYGIAQRANPDIRVRDLDLEGAAEVYFNKYWSPSNCYEFDGPLAITHFDGCVNHGIGRANRFLQTAVGSTPDGMVGPKTIAAAKNKDPLEVALHICDLRIDFYEAIVANNPSQIVFLKGWTARIDDLRRHITALTG